jgi:hypothetical protein
MAKTALGYSLSQFEWRALPPPFIGLSGWQLVGTDLRVVETNEPVEHDDGREWYHVSCSRPDRIPSYDDLLRMKRTFCKGRTAFQIFPPEERHISGKGIGNLGNPYALHLWCCVSEDGAGFPDFGKEGHI